ncbi:thiamine phosphate synthase [Edaphocola aurantiacus]|uniref:thiamine phosphate synthase n=1 Tax=Edaphocola aurantiacus TaxID=2601682 RepID=UPI001C987EDC|nr:thiamine phosphate synthase [Edaphocola aurantiacus]
MIAVTLPLYVPSEERLITAFFQEGLELLHVRKPGIERECMRRWLEAIPADFHSRLVLHQHHELAEAYGIQRLHVPEYLRAEAGQVDLFPEYTYATSVHDINTFNSLDEGYTYAFLSPVLESISKPGYKSPVSLLDQVSLRVQQGIALVALGGIHAGNLSDIDHKGFDDFAVSGGLWYASDPLQTLRELLAYPLNK